MGRSKKVKELLAEAYILFENYVGNNGNFDYPDKEYGYLSDEIEDVEVGYFKYGFDKLDSDYSEQLRADGFTITASEAVDILQHRIDVIKMHLKESFYLFGEDACRIYKDRGMHELIERLRLDISIPFNLFTAYEGETSADQVLEAYEGWRDYVKVDRNTAGYLEGIKVLKNNL